MDEKPNTTNEKPNTTNEMKANIGKTTAIVFSFDTTGSMNPCIMQVRKQLRDLVESMTQDIPDLRIGLIAHGDYCDGENAIKVLDLTNDLEAIMNFINNTPNTGGGDAPECYELALHRARHLSWPAEGGSVVLIGDDEPHTPDYKMNTDKLDWREEVRALKAKNVSVFPLQCLKSNNRHQVNKFWEQVSGESNTPLLFLENFQAEAGDAVEALGYAAAGATAYGAYERKAASRTRGMTSNMAENAGKLKMWTDTKDSTPTPPSEEKTE